MKTSRRTERGQVLILIVFGLIGLIGITALAVDGGNAYFNRRRAQNAADAAAMAAGLAKIRQLPSSPAGAWKDAGFARAAGNGFTDNGARTTVKVYACTEPDAACTLPAGVNLAEYVKVRIVSVVDTWFGPVVGIMKVTNQVEAIAKAKPSEPDEWFNGSALVSVMPGCKVPGWPNFPFVAEGNSSTVVTGGIFVNSDCETRAYTQGGSSSVTASPGTCVVGASTSTNTNPPPTHDCNQISPSKYVLPNPVCDRVGKVTSTGGRNYTASSGTYNGPFPGVSPAGKLKLQKGIYCLNDGLDVNSQWEITTDTNGNSAHESFEGVMFFVPHGGVTFNGGSNTYLHAITCKQCGLDEALVGYLFYLPPTNTSPVRINGGSNFTLVGTILAPGSLITLEGGSSTSNPLNLQSQIIGYSIKIAGNSFLNIKYDETLNAITWTNPELQPFK